MLRRLLPPVYQSSLHRALSKLLGHPPLIHARLQRRQPLHCVRTAHVVDGGLQARDGGAGVRVLVGAGGELRVEDGEEVLLVAQAAGAICVVLVVFVAVQGR